MARYAWLALFSAVISGAAAVPTATVPATAGVNLAPSTTSLFVMDPGQPSSMPTVHASVMRVIPSLSQTQYWIMCEIGRSGSPPCDYIDGASVTIDPTGMALNIRRATYIVKVRLPRSGEPSAPTDDPRRLVTERTSITVRGTASCNIAGSTWASCTGEQASLFEFSTGWESSVWITGGGSHFETISTVLYDIAAHSISITVTGGLEKLPTGTASSTMTHSRAGLRVTRVGRALIAGAVALSSSIALVQAWAW
ncbi:hypothetical protein MMYC01_202545 [Madurella mycetomatis]|uniref:Uncharacterized protein n=1 Tax=Madurella mycetomatis TaxID=100816 RepID=A0A175W7I0_9PEZI|nr:hypothetical protein MMYC01_202545 [Madurella mycetomatis]